MYDTTWLRDQGAWLGFVMFIDLCSYAVKTLHPRILAGSRNGLGGVFVLGASKATFTMWQANPILYVLDLLNRKIANSQFPHHRYSTRCPGKGK